jgi:predicted fused transcriptional regulator/phosphomethylpyrimidine kinase/predicted transcriptional regulator
MLPVVRRLLALELVNGHGVSQVQVARVLGVTQPAVSNYLNTKLRLRRPPMEGGLEEMRLMVKAFAEDFVNGRVSQIEAMRRVCGLCNQMRNRGPICTIHGEDVPSLRSVQCSFCLRDLSDIRRITLEEYRFVEDLRRAVQIMEETEEMAALIPEIGMNIVYAKPEASVVEEVVGVPGRIRPIRGRLRASSSPEFGGSSHVSRAVLTMKQFEPSILSAISLKFDQDFVEICRGIGLVVSFFDRSEEPSEVKRVDGRTIPWGVRQAVERIEKVPDVIYDLGDIGKEPMIFLFGTTPQQVALLAMRIAAEYAERRAVA